MRAILASGEGLDDKSLAEHLVEEQLRIHATIWSILLGNEEEERGGLACGLVGDDGNDERFRSAFNFNIHSTAPNRLNFDRHAAGDALSPA
jgi:hypothetical protein